MHAFMAAVLLGVARLNPLDANTKPEPPDRELAQIKQGMGGSEGHAVIAADVGRQAALLKKPLKHSEISGACRVRASRTSPAEVLAKKWSVLGCAGSD